MKPEGNGQHPAQAKESVRFFELHEKKFVLLLLCAFAAVHVFIFSAGFPMFNQVDEDVQFDVVLRYARGEMPKKIDLISTNSAAYLGLMASPEFFDRMQLGPYAHFLSLGFCEFR